MPFPYRKILIPLDFSKASLRAAAHGFGMAGASGASVVLLTVVDTSFPYPDLYSFEDPNHDYFKVMRERALARMEEAAEEIGVPEGVTIDRLIARGRPKVEIPAMAREVAADLVVIARHGAGGIAKAILGSTTEALLRAAPCPVLVLPGEAED